MLNGLLSQPYINDQLLSFISNKINNNFTINIDESFEDCISKIFYVDRYDTSFFSNHKIIFDTIFSDFFLKRNDSLTIVDSEGDQTIKIDHSREFINIANLKNENKILKIYSTKTKEDPDINFENLLNITLDHSISLIIRTNVMNNAIEAQKEINNRLFEKTSLEKIKFLNTYTTDPMDRFYINKFIETYDLSFLMILEMKNNLKSNQENYKKFFLFLTANFSAYSSLIY